MRPALRIIDEIMRHIHSETDRLTLIENWGRGIALRSLVIVARKAAMAEKMDLEKGKAFARWACGEGSKILLSLYVLRKLADL